jgi:ElaB/YqjD/DUF883 family membrane-anchored ribosome-binding protein
MNTKKAIGIAKKKGGEFERIAKAEYAKIKNEMDVTAKKVEAYVKNNPKEAALISAGIGAALGVVAGLIASGGKKKKKR